MNTSVTLVEILGSGKSQRDRCLIILYYGVRAENRESLSTKDVAERLRQARIPRASKINVSDVLTKSGDLVESTPDGGRGRLWRLTPTGTERVERLLQEKFAHLPRWAHTSDGQPKRIAEVRLLFLGVAPTDSVQLRLDEECREVTNRIRAAEHRDALKMTNAWAVRPDDVFQYLHEHKPHVVHFSGHGSRLSELAFEDKNGRTKLITTRALATLFETMADAVRVVVLNACHSATAAKQIAQHIDCTVGMADAIDDRTAIQFASAFYRAIGFGKSVQRAFREARASVIMEGLPGDDVPQLFVRDGVNPDSVILAQELD